VAEEEGKLVTCDLCGATVFLRCVETREYDGGFSRVRTFEKKPDGWQTWHVSNVISSTLCPSCNERMQEALLACIGRIKEGTD
jgi:hypothetical protein